MIEFVLMASLVIVEPEKVREFLPGDVIEVWERRQIGLYGRWRRRIVVAGPFGLGTRDEEWDMVFPIENLATQTWRFTNEKANP